MANPEVTERRRHMLAALRLPLQLLREHPALVLRFAFASLGRAALTAATILLIREFLAGALLAGCGLAEFVRRSGDRGADADRPRVSERVPLAG
jgi:hypothetical protein